MARTKTFNKNLHNAHQAKKDEFYTQLPDIEKEMYHYWKHFRGKVILCNCDDPYESNFFKYFVLKFNDLGIKKLIATCYKDSMIQGLQLSLLDIWWSMSQGDNKHPYKIEITEVPKNSELLEVEYLLKNKRNVLTPLKGDGDFRSPECIELLKQADIVVTNPPFSLFRKYVTQLMEYDKKFLIIGSLNAITYKECFKLIKDNKMWLGYNNGAKTYLVPDSYDQKNTFIGVDGKKYATMGNTGWFTNLDHTKLHEPLILYKKYSPSEYPNYDNYDAINVGKVSDIPLDYHGVMGVPITFLDKYNPKQFEILGIANNVRWIGYECLTIINGEKVYNRILIKSKKVE